MTPPTRRRSARQPIDPRPPSPRPTDLPVPRRPQSATHPPDSDEALLAATRAGDSAAFAMLYDRHAAAARKLARALTHNPHDADDLVAEAVTKVLAALRGGHGPRIAFRAYLLTAIRHARYDRTRRDRRVELIDDFSRYESTEGSAGDPIMARLERAYAARAFAKLPERWRLVLWHTEVEGEPPAAIAPRLDLSPNAVATIAYRARERLRQLYLQEHLQAITNPACRWTADRLGAYVRRTLPRRERGKVEAHLAGCRGCQALRAELVEVNAGLGGMVESMVLGPPTTPYLTARADPSWWASLTSRTVTLLTGRGHTALGVPKLAVVVPR